MRMKRKKRSEGIIVGNVFSLLFFFSGIYFEMLIWFSNASARRTFFSGIDFEMFIWFSNASAFRTFCFDSQRDGSDKTVLSHEQRGGRQKEKLNEINTLPP